MQQTKQRWALLLCGVVLLSSIGSSLQQATAKKSAIVKEAPEAELENAIDDIDVTNGKCKEFFTSSTCKEVEPGEGRVAGCIGSAIDASEAGEAKDGESVPDECQEELYRYYVNRGSNINKNVPLATACKADADKFCKNLLDTGAGAVIACLRENKDALAKGCSKEVTQVQAAIARDYRVDPTLYVACKGDAEKLCGDVKDGGGRILSCLRDKSNKGVSWECQEQLVVQEAEEDDDVRLSTRLFKKCLSDKKRFCADVEPGHGAARDCLVEHREDSAFSKECKEELDSMIERRVRDFRLDARLRRACQTDMHDLCGSTDGFDGDETDLGLCLQDSVEDIRDQTCQSMVKKYQELAAQDIRFDVPLAEACYEDRAKYCASVPPGSARVIRCLQSSRDKLSTRCRAVLFDEEVRFSENIDFQYPMKQACDKEIKVFCKGVPHGNARVIRCLQDNKSQKDFGKACREEVVAYEQKASQDYRLNFRLKSTCRADIESLCKEACHSQDKEQLCGGTVLRCLTEKKDEIKNEDCKKEVFYYEKMEVSDFNNDVILAAACRTDVDRFCKDVKPGDGRMHACLRKNRKELSDACRREELLLEQTEAEHIELRPSLLKACADERSVFCKDVRPGSARVFRCLAEKLADPDFGASCRTEVVKKLLRRQANWRLDPPLRKACKADVADMCKAEDTKNSEQGLVYQCLIKNHDDLDPGCKKELGRAVHMAFFIWAPGAPLTKECDEDVERACLKPRPNMDRTPGAVGSCLADILEQMQAAESTGRKSLKDPAAPATPTLTDTCRVLADVAEPPNMKRAFETSLSVALLESQLSVLESTTGLNMLSRDRAGAARGVTLTGWTALAGVAAMVVLILAGAAFGWRRYRGVPDSSTVVLKSRQAYTRVNTSGE